MELVINCEMSVSEGISVSLYMLNEEWESVEKNKVKYRSRALKSRGSYGNSTLYIKKLQYISLDFYVLRKSQKAKCGS